MTTIEHAAKALRQELGEGRVQYPSAENNPLAIITRHLTALTKPLEDENKRLKSELVEWQTVGSDVKTQQKNKKLREALIWSLTYLENNIGVIPEHYDRYEQAKALTKPT